MPNESAVTAAKEFIATLPEAEQGQFKDMSETALEKLGAGVLRQSDYTKKTTELKTKRDELEAWQVDANKKYTTMREENVNLQGKVSTTEAKLAAIARDYNIDLAELKMQQEATGESATEAAQSVQRQGGQAVEGNDDYRKYTEQMTENMTALSLEAADLVADHQEIFGTRIKAFDLVKEAMQAGKPVREYWNEKYDVEAKQEELATAKQQEWEENLRKEVREETRRELIADGATLTPDASADLGSPLFNENFGKEYLASQGKDGDAAGQEGRVKGKGISEKDRMAIVSAAAKDLETNGLTRARESGEGGF
jgi:hypothetical protein